MKIRRLLSISLLLCAMPAFAGVEVDMDALGKSLGGWLARKGKAAEYELSDAGYRTYQPEVSPSPDGGIFISMRIDHRRGFMASDDYASLELSFAPDGSLVSAQSSLALQGRTISSELIRGGASATTSVAAPQIDRAVKVGTDLVADLSSKLLREKIVEPGRVSFPAAIRHNYNLLYKAVKFVPDTPPPAPAPGDPAAVAPPAGPIPLTPPAAPAPASGPLLPTHPAPLPPAPPTPPAPTPPPAAQTAPDPNKKKEIPIPDVKLYNPSGGPTTPIPPKKEQSLIRQMAPDALKLAREVVKSEKK